MQQNHPSFHSFDQSIVRRISKEIQQEQSNLESRIVLIPPTNEDYRTLQAFYFVKQYSVTGSPLLSQEANSNQNASEHFIYTDCVIEIQVIIPKMYPIISPRFKFPQQPMHPSFRGESICCGVSCEFKKNWNPTQTIFSGIYALCASIVSIPRIMNDNQQKLDLTRDCNFEMISMIRKDEAKFLDRCVKWAAQKGHLLHFISNSLLYSYLKKNTHLPLVSQILTRIQFLIDRRTSHQLRLLEQNAALFSAFTISQLKQILSLTNLPIPNHQGQSI